MSQRLRNLRSFITEQRVIAMSVILLLLTSLASIMAVWGVRPGETAFVWLFAAVTSAVLGLAALSILPYFEASSLVDQARVLIAQGRYQEALLHLNRAIHLCPRFADAYITRSAAYTGLSQIDLAAEDAERAVSIAPQQPDLRLARARLFSHRGLDEDAIRDLKIGLDHKPDWAAGYLELAQLHLKLEDYESGLATLRAIDARRAPEHIRYEAFMLAGLVYEKNLQNLDMAITSYSRAIPILPDRKDGYMRRSHAYHERGDLYQAAEDLLRAAQRVPTPEDADHYHWLRAFCYNRRWTITHEDRDFAAWIDALQLSISHDAPEYREQSRKWLDSLTKTDRQKTITRYAIKPPPKLTVYPN